MSRTEKWTNDFLNRSEFFDRSHEQEVPEPLRSLARDLDAREPLRRGWYRAHSGKVVKGYVLGDILLLRWPAWIRQGVGWCVILLCGTASAYCTFEAASWIFHRAFAVYMFFKALLMN